MSNRLAQSISPYLQQHADNPVDWWPWGTEALSEARTRDVPVFISIGYAACHWCHVMAHESFEDEQLAAYLNKHFVCIKVDREEHPDVDAIYMEATQALTGHGGWPMTVFATAEGKPFYCGTYYPPQPAHGMPSFMQILTAVIDTWQQRRDELDGSADRIAAGLGQRRDFPEYEGDLADSQSKAVQRLLADFDQQHGGFGGAPKFPPSTVLKFLVDHASRVNSPDAEYMVGATCEAMARGGMYDQLAGGFARYSVDATWTVPHFEKMLYDNALLARVYSGWARAGGPPIARRIAIETLDFMINDLRTDNGGLASALDADTEGVEGSTYVWTPEQLAEVTGSVEAAEIFAVTDVGSFEHGTSVLQLPLDPEDENAFAEMKVKLLAARAMRPQPARDDKVVAAWNGMAITALCEAGRLFEIPRYIEVAVRIATVIDKIHMHEGRLRRVSRDGNVGAAGGVLEDYAHVATGYLHLHCATADRRWLEKAVQLLTVADQHFAGTVAGQYFDTADDAPALIVRPGEPLDGPTPSGVAALAEAFILAGSLTDDASYRSRAEQICAAVGAIVEAAPRAAGAIAAINEVRLAGPLQIAITGPAGPERAALTQIAVRDMAPGTVVVTGNDPQASPLLEHRAADIATAYVCRGFVCQLPVHMPTELQALLATAD
ncbi:MAG: thioredoxin domain-containing protein [Antricoccus sp.]